MGLLMKAIIVAGACSSSVLNNYGSVDNMVGAFENADVLWIVIVGFLVAFFLAFGVGANDVANSFGTSVGAKVLTLKQACILATFCEILGAILLGYKVSDTVRKGIFNVTLYEDHEKTLMLGNLASLLGSAIWNILATFFSLPISGTHSIVGAVVGFSLVARGAQGIRWLALLKIVASWFISPVFSGIISAGLHVIIKKFILDNPTPFKAGLFALPFFYSFTVFVNVFSVVHDGPRLFYFDRLPLWGVFVSSFAFSLSVALFVWLWLVPRLRKRIEDDVGLRGGGVGGTTNGPMAVKFAPRVLSTPDASSDEYTAYVFNGPGLQDDGSERSKQPRLNGADNGAMTPSSEKSTPNKNGTTPQTPPSTPMSPISNGSGQLCVDFTDKRLSIASMERAVLEDHEHDDTPEIARIFSFLQILTAIFGSFTHGGNDVSNAIGPLVSIWATYNDGSVMQNTETPIWVLLYGGVGISVGLWVWGRRVIRTIGTDLTKVTPSSGFCIEVGSATTVLLASKIGIPISTTHCKVGSIVFLGWLKSRSAVDWRLFRGIVMAWLLTLPITGGLSAAITAVFMATVNGAN